MYTSTDAKSCLLRTENVMKHKEAYLQMSQSKLRSRISHRSFKVDKEKVVKVPATKHMEIS